VSGISHALVLARHVREEPPPRWRRSDPSLVEAAKAGSKDAFGRLYTGLGARVRQMTEHVLRDTHDAEDAMQDAFVAAYRRIGSLADTGAFETWMLRIARNTAVTRARRRKRLRPSLRAHDEDADNAPGMPRVVTRSGATEPPPSAMTFLRATYDEFSSEVRETVRLRYEQGLTCKEIASQQDVTLSCIKTRLHRARQRLRAAVLET
jgi:RNA polymerase sigma-70 factor (ECF subfamily)